MRRTLFSRLSGGVVGVLMLLAPHVLFAAQLTFKTVPHTAAGGGATVVEVRIDPQSHEVNAVEGVINFQGAASDALSVNVETGGSVLALWPTPPRYLSGEKAIRFVGGVPNGFHEEGLLFRLRLSSSLAGGEAIVSLIDGVAYLNDGKGTAEAIPPLAMSVTLDQQRPDTVTQTSPDTVPPQFDAVEMGRDPDAYDGKYFISFYATDDISGVARYEVKEGQAVTDISDGVYVLKDQKRTTPITITAYDQAGNSATIEISARLDWAKNVIIISVFIIILLFVFRYGYKKFIKK